MQGPGKSPLLLPPLLLRLPLLVFWEQEIESDMTSNAEVPLFIMHFLVLSSFHRKPSPYPLHTALS